MSARICRGSVSHAQEDVEEPRGYLRDDLSPSPLFPNLLKPGRVKRSAKTHSIRRRLRIGGAWRVADGRHERSVELTGRRPQRGVNLAPPMKRGNIIGDSLRTGMPPRMACREARPPQRLRPSPWRRPQRFPGTLPRLPRSPSTSSRVLAYDAPGTASPWRCASSRSSAPWPSQLPSPPSPAL